MKSPHSPTPADRLDPLLDRYARLSAPPPDPWFAAKVLRRVRAGRTEAELGPLRMGIFDLFLTRAGYPLLIAIAATGLWMVIHQPAINPTLADSATSEREVVEQLDVLIADVQSTYWQEADPLF